jgi:hypothetical protein
MKSPASSSQSGGCAKAIMLRLRRLRLHTVAELGQAIGEPQLLP